MLFSLIFSVFAFASTKLSAEYEVPVPLELAAYSFFKMDPVKVDERSGEVRVRYYLPRLLAGNEIEIKMEGRRGSDGVFRLAGEGARAECDGFEAGRQCFVGYKGLNLDLALAEAELDRLALPDSDREGILRVIRRFQGVDRPAFEASFLAAREGGDMQGIIHFGAPVEGHSED